MSQQGVLGLAGCIKITLDRGGRSKGELIGPLHQNLVKNKIRRRQTGLLYLVTLCEMTESGTRSERGFGYKNKHNYRDRQEDYWLSLHSAPQQQT
jgi:hypothetical protein